MTQFTLTMDQIKTIYEAGIRRGADEGTAYEWGGQTSGGKFDELTDTMHDILNVDLKFDDANYKTYDVVEEIVAG
jgi:hypothetical protein